MGPNEFYAIQPAFTGGEISGDVASRVDIEKYQLALLQAENAVIRPYGAVRKRPGLIFCGKCKYSDRKAILYRFDFTVEISYLLEIGHEYIRIWRNGQYLNVELTTPYREADLPKLRFVQSVDVLYICSGDYPVKKLARYADTDWRLNDIDWTVPAFADLNKDEGNTITPSAASGTVTLTAAEETFTAAMAGDWIKLNQFISGKNVHCTGGISAAIPVGGTWKVITHGTWSGNVEVQVSQDGGATWLMERKYTSSKDYNPTESGTVEEYCLMRLVVTVTDGSCSADLSAYPYSHEGYAKITSVTSPTQATAEVVKAFGDTTPTADWYPGAWSETNGYPNCAVFFQDRLCFGGNKAYPQRLWMSRTGDYENFSVDKEEGTVTDDSAVTANLLSLKSYKIHHMDSSNDLIIYTEGNEWTIGGSSTVTPSDVTPRNQQNNGCADVLPVRVNNRVIYVQRRGSIVRDMGYSYDSDSYTGMDLTILAKHLIKNKELIAASFAQEPDSCIYFVRNDGVLLCLAYIPEQKVYAWSHIITDGSIEAVAGCQQGNNDVTYVITNRTVNGKTEHYIERMDADHDSDYQQDYVMMDAATHYQLAEPAAHITGLDYLEGKTVCVMGDGYLYEKLTVKDGAVDIDEPATDIIVGLPYTMIIEQPNFETQMRDGSAQGREKTISFVILRLSNSFGGEIGPNSRVLSDIIYDVGTMELGQHILYTGDKKVTLASGGFNIDGRVYIRHDKPYPFTLSAIIRAVTFGG